MPVGPISSRHNAALAFLCANPPGGRFFTAGSGVVAEEQASPRIASSASALLSAQNSAALLVFNFEIASNMTSAAYLPVLIQICLAAGAGLAILALKLVSSQRGQKNKIKDSAYECGIPAEGLVHTRFSVKFYLTALLFMLFDLEVVILIPWTFIYRDFLANHIAILTPMLVFIGVLVLGLVYEVKKGALEWEK
jgi:NADH-quinone oxidoreductase subunit A